MAMLKLLQRIEAGYIPTEKELQAMKTIRVVDFSPLVLTSLPESIGMLSQLTILNLHHNQLTNIPNLRNPAS